MIVNSIRCDGPECDTEAPTEAAEARYFLTLKLPGYPSCPAIGQDDLHFCCVLCLRDWAQKEMDSKTGH